MEVSISRSINEQYTEIHNQAHATKQLKRARAQSKFYVYLLLFAILFFLVLRTLFIFTERILPGGSLYLLLFLYICLCVTFIVTRKQRFKIKNGMTVQVKLDNQKIEFSTTAQKMSVLWSNVAYFVELDDELIGFTKRKYLIFRKYFGIPKNKIKHFGQLKDYLADELKIPIKSE